LTALMTSARTHVVWGLSLVALLLVGCGREAQAKEPDHTEVLVLEPAAGAKLKNPVTFKGTIDGPLRSIVLRQGGSKVGVLCVHDARFRFPLFFTADEHGSVAALTLEAEGAESPTLELQLEPFDLLALEDALAAVDQALRASPPQFGVGLELASRLLGAGHPRFAFVVVLRLEASPEPMSQDERLELSVLRAEIDVVLRHDEHLREVLTGLQDKPSEPAELCKLCARLGERLFALSDFALVRAEAKLAGALLSAGNVLFERAGLLPRRLLKGY